MTEKLALFEIGTTSIRLTLCKTVEGERFVIYKSFSEKIGINEQIENDGLIKSEKIKEVIALISLYKKICEAENIQKQIAFVASNITHAKNYKSLVDEVANTTGLDVKILTPEAEVSAVYTSVINTLDVPKGIIVNISSHSTRIIHYNRRVVLDSVIIPFGSATLLKQAENMPLIAADLFVKELTKSAVFLQGLDPETNIVGVSDVFVAMGRIARKMKRYPVDIDHNYVTNDETFGQVFDFIKTLDVEKKQKIKGISGASTQTILSGMCIVDAILKLSGLKNIVVGCSYRSLGILFNATVPCTLERPVTDVLGYSLECIAMNSGLDKTCGEQVYYYALLLFKQLRVLHKLPRAYAKVLRIASHMYELGRFANNENFEKSNYSAILASPLMGTSHKEIVLAAFAASIKKWEDFNLAEWVKYKDLLTDEDLEAVRKIAVIVAMSSAINIRNQNIVKDITCDILGDSVIIKLLTEIDQRNKVDIKAAELEIFFTKKFSSEFTRAFKKNLEIL